MITCLGRRGRWGRLFSTSLEDGGRREVMEYDVLVVGGGVAGLSTAIKIKQISM
jgi:heterodisulfide reductase subunit A-like polyferredoxin